MFNLAYCIQKYDSGNAYVVQKLTTRKKTPSLIFMYDCTCDSILRFMLVFYELRLSFYELRAFTQLLVQAIQHGLYHFIGIIIGHLQN